MVKVRILDQCEYCDGEAYVFVCEDVDARGEMFDRYRPCEICHGSGNQAKWVSLREFADLLERAISITTNFQLLYIAEIITASVGSPNLLSKHGEECKHWEISVKDCVLKNYLYKREHPGKYQRIKTIITFSNRKERKPLKRDSS